MVDWNLAINVTVTGIVLVFAMLLLLVFILLVFGWISVSIKNAADKKSKREREAVLAALSNDGEVNDVVEAAVCDNNGLSDELIAVISAAVATMYIGSDKKPIIKTVKRTAGRRSAWGNAGVIDNTRAF